MASCLTTGTRNLLPEVNLWWYIQESQAIHFGVFCFHRYSWFYTPADKLLCCCCSENNKLTSLYNLRASSE
jgi:hypothetical protein